MEDAQGEKLEKHVQSMRIVKLGMHVEENMHGLIDRHASHKLLLEHFAIQIMIV